MLKLVQPRKRRETILILSEYRQLDTQIKIKIGKFESKIHLKCHQMLKLCNLGKQMEYHTICQIKRKS